MSLGRGFERASLQVLLRELEDIMPHREDEGVSDAAADHGASHGIPGEVLHVVVRLPGEDEVVHRNPLEAQSLKPDYRTAAVGHIRHPRRGEARADPRLGGACLTVGVL